MFPKTVEEFMEEYKMVDKDHVYSNGIEYVPIFRMKQWFEHISSAQSELSNNSKELDNKNGELISRQKAKDAIDMALDHIDHVPLWVYDNLLNALNEVPSVPRNGKWDCYTEDIDGLSFRIKRCSMCGASKPMKIFHWEDTEINFCPNCGCRMEEGDSDD